MHPLHIIFAIIIANALTYSTVKGLQQMNLNKNYNHTLKQLSFAITAYMGQQCYAIPAGTTLTFDKNTCADPNNIHNLACRTDPNDLKYLNPNLALFDSTLTVTFPDQQTAEININATTPNGLNFTNHLVNALGWHLDPLTNTAFTSLDTRHYHIDEPAFTLLYTAAGLDTNCGRPTKPEPASNYNGTKITWNNSPGYLTDNILDLCDPLTATAVPRIAGQPPIAVPLPSPSCP